MNKLFKLGIVGMSALVLGACGGNTTPETEEDDNTPETEEVKEAETTETSEGETTESEIGKSQVVKDIDSIGLTKDVGDISVTVDRVAMTKIEPKDDYKEMFGGKDEFTVLQLKVSVTNNGEDTLSVYPDQGVLVTDTGEQIDMPDFMLTEPVGGDFYGGVTQEGSVSFIIDSNPEDVKSIKYIVGAPHDSDFNSMSESDLEFEIELN